MSILEPSEVKGLVNGFIPKVEAAMVSEPQNPTRAPKAQVINWRQKFIDASQQLTADEQKQVLQQQFAQELEQLKQSAIEEGIEQGRKQAEEDAKHSLAKHSQEQDAVQKRWQLLLDGLSEKSAIELDQPEQLLTLLSQALLKMIAQELQSPDYAQSLLEQLAREYVEERDIILSIPPQYFQDLQQAKIIDKTPVNIRLRADESLSMGEYRIGLTGGDIAVSLDAMWESFRQGCIEFCAQETSA